MISNLVIADMIEFIIIWILMDCNETEAGEESFKL